MKRAWKIAFWSVVILFVAAQLVPYGHRHDNPPAGTPVAFDSPVTQRLAERACYDCHSNRTAWPWYSSIAPASWVVQHDVDEGREKLDFTNFQPRKKAVADAVNEAAETVTKGEMPLPNYLMLHPGARLNGAEQRQLAQGLDATFAPFKSEDREHDEERD
jgi:hypothetical protein